jgi:large subunit ribosomal protein L15e
MMWGSIDWSTAPSVRQDGSEDVNRREDGSRKWHEVILLDHEHPAIENDDDLDWIWDDSRSGQPFRGKTGVGVRTRHGLPRQGDRTHPPEPLSDGRRGK